MVADGGLILSEAGSEITDAERFVLLSEEIEQGETRGITQCLEPVGQRSGLLARQARRSRGAAARVALVAYREGSGEGIGVHVGIIQFSSMDVNGS
jgi:hypothetical protein